MGLLAVAAGPSLHAQYAHFSGVQIAIPSSSLSTPSQLAADGSGNIYIADSGNGRVLKEAFSAGGYTESTVVTGLSSPQGVAVDASGNVYIADAAANQVLKETPSVNGYTQTTIGSGLNAPGSVAVDASGNVYLADSGNRRVLIETPTTGSYAQAVVPTSALGNQISIAVDATGRLYIADTANARVLKETPSGTTYVESAIVGGIYSPTGIAVDGTGNVYISDPYLLKLLKMSVSGTSYVQSSISFSGISSPRGVAVDGNGNLYLADANRVLESPVSDTGFDPTGVGASTVPRSLIFTHDGAGYLGIPSIVTQGATGLDFSDKGTGTCNTNGPSYLYVRGTTCTVDVVFSAKASGARYGAVLLTSSSGSVIATGFVKGMGVGPQLHFLPGTYTSLSFNFNAYAIATDASSNLYIVENLINNPSNRVFKETWNGSGYTQTMVATGFSNPSCVAIDGAGNVYIADRDSATVTQWTPSGSSYTLSQSYTGLGTVTSLAVDGGGNLYVGSLTSGLTLFPAGSTLPYSISRALKPIGLAVDFNGVLYITDDSNELVTETLVNGAFTQTTIASSFNRPFGVTVDSNSNVYVADMFNNRVVKLTRSGGSYSQATFLAPGEPQSIAFDAAGNFYASTDGGGPILKLDTLTPPGLSFASTVTGNASPAQSVTLANYGNAPLTFPLPSSGNNPSVSTNFGLDTTGSAACPQVSATSTKPATLAADSSCQLAVRFVPTIGGSLTGSLVLTDDNLNTTSPNYATQTIALSGSALQGPTLSFAAFPSPIVYGIAPFPINAITNSAGPITYSIRSGPATVSGSTITITGVGTVVLDFTLAPSGIYTGAGGSMSFVVLPIGPRLTLAAFPKVAYGDPPFTISATSASNGPVTYTVLSGPATISGSTVTVTGVGIVTIEANQAPSGIYGPASLGATFEVAAGSAAITLTIYSNTANTKAGGIATFPLSVTPVKTFLNPITLSVTGLPKGATATFSPATVAAGSGVTSVTLSVQTSPQTARFEKLSRIDFASIAFGIFLLPLVGFKSIRNSFKRGGILSCIFAIAALSVGILMAGCSSGNSSGSQNGGGGTPSTPQSYPLVVTARDAATGAQISGSLTLAIQ